MAVAIPQRPSFPTYGDNDLAERMITFGLSPATVAKLQKAAADTSRTLGAFLVWWVEHSVSLADLAAAVHDFDRQM